MKALRLLFLAIAAGLSALTAFAAAPSITRQPTNQVLAAGETMTLGVTADGDTPVSYQWFKDSRWILGATNSTLTVTNADVTASGVYYAVVTNVSGMAISLPVSVAVGNPSLMAWGDNSRGQLGNGSTANANRPVSITNNAVAGAAGNVHSLFVTADGTLWAMGYNAGGQLGNGTTNDAHVPISVASNVVAVAAGPNHSLFVNTNGTLWAMGYNWYGQLGDGTTNDTRTPVSVASNVVAAATGWGNSLFVTTDGTLWTMGYGGFGQLGNGTYNNTNKPISVASNVVAVAGGEFHSLFVNIDGTLWGMGYNSSGQLGNGISITNQPTIVASKVVAVAAGDEHSLFVTADGKLWAMGYNRYGQLGNGSDGTAPNPTPMSVASNVVAVAAGSDHSLFVKADSTIWAMGYNYFGQLGNGASSPQTNSTPINVAIQLVLANIFPTAGDHSLAIGSAKSSANLTLDGLSQLYTGSAINVTASTMPPGLTVSLTYNGSPTPPKTVGTYTVVGTIIDRNYFGTVTNTLIVNPAAATVTLGNLNQIYTGRAIYATATTVPPGLIVNLKYGGSSIAPTNVGSYTVIGTVSDSNGYGSATNTLVISTAAATVTLGSLIQFYNGSTRSATATTRPAGLAVIITYNGSADPPANVGSYTVVGTVNDPNGYGSATNTLVVLQGPTNQVLSAGGTVALSVTTEAVIPLAYQWFKDSRKITGATNSTFTATNADVAVSGAYYVVATNFSGMGISVPALVAVGNPTLLAWGNNYDGQLGKGTSLNNYSTPLTVWTNVVAGAAGAKHSLFITADGKLWAMGYNASGQLGNGTYNSTNKPISVASNVVAVAAGTSHSLFVKSDGTLWAMGSSSYGQLGYGPFVSSTNMPVNVASNVVAIAAGGQHSLFVTTEGTLWTMGFNGSGQLGNNNFSNTNKPVSVASNVVAVAAGTNHSLFITRDGTLGGMGDGSDYKLGYGTGGSSTPIRITTNIVAVAAGAKHSLYVSNNGTLWAMGNNAYGQLGNGITYLSTPACVASNVLAVSAGANHSLLVSSNGILWAMGDRSFGQVGDGYVGSSIPFPLSLPHLYLANVFPGDAANHSLALGVLQAPATITLSNLSPLFTGGPISVTAITAPPGLAVNLTYNGLPSPPTSPGSYTVIATVADTYYYGSVTNTMMIRWPPSMLTGPTNQAVPAAGTISFGITTDGSQPQAFQWFKDGRMIVGATNTSLTVTNADESDSGAYFVVATNWGGMVISRPALVAAGNPALLAWGNNNYGQLGNGTTNPTNKPVNVADHVVAGAAGQNHSLFVTGDGTLWAMGNNVHGQLGDGTTNDVSTPASVASNVVAVAAGTSHSLYVTAGGVLWAMGHNGNGQLGNGTNYNASNPVSVASNVVAVAAGDQHSLFVTADGTLWAMGNGWSGQLGNGGFGYTNKPVSVASNVVAAAAGQNHSLFVKTDGTLWAMGYNGNGQLGNGTTSMTNKPTSVASNVVAMATGANHSMFVKTDGALWTMGYNDSGQLGKGSFGTTPNPIPMSVASNVLTVAGGANHSLFVSSNGTCQAMGANNSGQLGNGTVGPFFYWPGPVSHLFSVANVFPASMASHSLAIGKLQSPASVTLSNLDQVYTGSPAAVTALTTPPGIAVSLTYNGSPLAPTNAGSYTVIGTLNDPNYYGSSVTNTLAVKPMGPANQMVAPGGTINLSVNAGIGATQWFKDSRKLLGATTSALTITNAAVTDSGVYYAVITKPNGMVISTPALVAVGNPCLMAWGNNAYGQLGNGMTTNVQSTPVTVAGNVVAGAAGQNHSLFITGDGTLWAMGYNVAGQLGNGTNSSTSKPISVMSNVVAAAAGIVHSLFVTGDGTLWAMGDNSSGQLGKGAFGFTNKPISVASNVVAVAAGAAHSLFLKWDGTVWAMGNNDFGQLGNGTLIPTNKPVSVASNVVALAAGQAHSLFIITNGVVLVGTGDNNRGQLGYSPSDYTCFTTPVAVADYVSAVAAGGNHSLFVRTSGNGVLWTSGRNSYGQLGNGTTNDTYASPFNGKTNVVANTVLAAAAGANHSLFMKADGTLWTMGNNANGQLGNGTNTSTPNPTPFNVPGLTAVNVLPASQASHCLAITLPLPPRITIQPTNQTVAIGRNVSLAVIADGGMPLAYQWFKDSRRVLGATNSTLAVSNADVTDSGVYYLLVTNGLGMVISLPVTVAVGNPSLLAWGSNGEGQLGNGSNGNYYSTPIGVTNNVVAGAAGWRHSLLVKADRTLWAMGNNESGQLGIGSTNSTETPTFVTSNVVSVAAGLWHSLLVKTDGTLWAMGINTYGQLGRSNIVQATSPISVASNVVAVGAGAVHSLFVKTDGTLWAMGDNTSGEFGNGTNSTWGNSTPISVASNVVTVAAGWSYSLFVKTDGTLLSMGGNVNGVLGNGTGSPTNIPVIVASNVVAVAAGSSHALFETSDTMLWGMGDNEYGQLGRDPYYPDYQLWFLSPISVASNVVAVAAGSEHSLFVTSDGMLWGMGYNGSGQLGNGTTNDAYSPINVNSALLPLHLSVVNIFQANLANHSLAMGYIQAPATVMLDKLNQVYTGNAISVTATTSPTGLTVNLTYNGSVNTPTNPGSYTVVGTISDPNYYGATSSTLVVGMPPQSFTAGISSSNSNSRQLIIQLNGTPNYPYILQSATNLTPPINWQSVFTNPADANGNWQFTDTNLDSVQNFYRATVP